MKIKKQIILNYTGESMIGDNSHTMKGVGPAWGAALIIMPRENYLHYVELDVLRSNFLEITSYYQNSY